MFFERYVECCRNAGIAPTSQDTADLWNVEKATISAWKKNGNVPKGDVIAAMANKFGVSADYLLEIPDDCTQNIEPEILKLYKKLDSDDQKKAIEILKILHMDPKY